MLFALAMLSLLLAILYATQFYQRSFEQVAEEQRRMMHQHAMAQQVRELLSDEIAHWKNVLIRGHERGMYHHYLSSYYQTERNARKVIETLLAQTAGNTALHELALSIRRDHGLLSRQLRLALTTFNEVDITPHIAADQAVGDQDERLKQSIDFLIQQIRQETERNEAAIEADLDKQRLQLLWTTLIIILAMFFALFWLLDRRIGRPVQQAMELQGIIDRAQSIVGFGHWLREFDSGKVTWTRGMYHLLGMEPGQQADTELHLSRIHPQDREKWLSSIARAMAEGGSYTLRYRLLTTSGAERVMQEQGRVAPDGGSTPQQLVVVTADITDLSRAEDRLNDVAVNIPGAVYSFVRDSQGRYRLPFISDGIKDIAGVSAADAQADFGLLMAVVLEEDRTGLIDSIEAAATACGNWHHEFRVHSPGGEVRWLRGSSVSHRLPDGAIEWHGILLDITESRLALAAREKSEADYRALVERSPDIIYRFSASTGNSYVSPRFEEVLGYPVEALSADPMLWHESIHPDDLPAVDQAIAFSAEGGAFDLEYRIRDAGGRWHWFRDRNIRIEGESGETIIHGLATDITDRKETAQKLRQSEGRFQSLVETSSDWIWEIDEQDRFTYASPKVRELLGYEPAELIGRSAFELMSGQEAERVDSVYRQLIQNHQPFSGMVNINRHKDGHEVVLESNGIPLFDDAGNWMGYRGIDRDITERRRAEEALTDREARLRAILNSAMEAIIVINDHGNIESVNPATARMFGYRHEELVNANVSILMAEPDRGLHDGYLKQYRETGEARIIGIGREVTARRKDGSSFPADLTVSEFNLGGKRMFTGILRDVTERVKAVAALQEREARLEEAQALAHLGNWNWHIQQDRLIWSDEIYRIFGLMPQVFSASYEAFLACVHPGDRAMVKDAVKQALEQMKSYAIDHRICLPDGSVRFVHEQGEVHYDDQDRPLRMLGTVQDITERKLTEQRLVDSLQEKDTLLRELHHRVKNNMQVISSILSLQARYSMGKDSAQVLNESRQRIRAMALVHERMYRDENLSRVNIKRYLSSLAERLERIHHQHHITPAITVDGAEIQLPVDEALPCALVVHELITNALKHAYPNTDTKCVVQISLACDAQGRVVISVQDWGVGIPAKVLEDDADSLGMLIIKSLCRQIGAQLEFFTGAGTLARVSLPANKAGVVDIE